MPDAEKWNENPLFRDLCVTIVECWDADAEARLSAGLVLTRVEQMSQTLLPANKRPVPPPQPPRQTPQQQQQAPQQHRHQQLPQPTQLTQARNNPPQVNMKRYISKNNVYFHRIIKCGIQMFPILGVLQSLNFLQFDSTIKLLIHFLMPDHSCSITISSHQMYL